jgi:hypothetical protein
MRGNIVGAGHLEARFGVAMTIGYANWKGYGDALFGSLYNRF